MNYSKSFLVEWSIKFLENKDAIKKDIIKIEKNKQEFDFIIYYKDRVKYFIIKEILEDNILSKLKENGHFGVITLNNSTNISFIAKNWNKLVIFNFLSIYLINPFSCLDKAWMLFPYTHNKICDNASLEAGLKSMSEMVEQTDENELLKKLKLKTRESDL